MIKANTTPFFEFPGFQISMHENCKVIYTAEIIDFPDADASAAAGAVAVAGTDAGADADADAVEKVAEKQDATADTNVAAKQDTAEVAEDTNAVAPGKDAVAGDVAEGANLAADVKNPFNVFPDMFEIGTPMDSGINWKLDFKQKYSYMANDDFI